MLDGLVNFEVDEYYTKNVVKTNEFTISTNSDDTRCEAYIDYMKTKEPQGLYDNYYSVLTIFNMEDYDGNLHHCAGSASLKFCIIHAESYYKQLLSDGFIMEDLLNLKYRDWYRTWTGNINIMLHEFTHTIEARVSIPLDFDRDYHTASATIWQSFMPDLTADEANVLATKYFLLNEAQLKGEKVGIPYELWKKMNGKDYDHPINY